MKRSCASGSIRSEDRTGLAAVAAFVCARGNIVTLCLLRFPTMNVIGVVDRD